MVCSNILATREYLVKQDDLIMVDHRDYNNVSEKIISSLADAKQRPTIRRACIDRLSKDSTCHAWRLCGLDLTTEVDQVSPKPIRMVSQISSAHPLVWLTLLSSQVA